MHFEQNQFMNTNRNSLIKTAVPTIFNISDNPKQLAHRKRAPAAKNELQPNQKSRSKGCGSCNRGTEEMTEIEGLPLNVNIIKEEITEEEPANEQYVDKSNFLPFYNVVIKEEHAEQKEADSEQNIEQRVTLLAQGKKNLQAEPSDEDEEAVDNYKFVDQCVLLPVITEAEGKETGECNINIREKSDQHTTGEIEETIGHVEQLNSLLRENINNRNKGVKQADGSCEHSITTSNPSGSCELFKELLPPSNLLMEYSLFNAEVNQYQCKECGQTFVEQSFLLKHKRVHRLSKHKLAPCGIQKYQCDICNATFAQSSNLSQHKLLHTGNRNYQCYVCNITVTDLSDLQRHKLMHNGSKTYQCDVCNKTFVNASNLSQHKFIHSKKYQCNICNRNFTSLATLSKHKLTHIDFRKYQ